MKNITNEDDVELLKSGYLTAYEKEVCESCFEHVIKQMQIPEGVYPCDSCEIYKSRKQIKQTEGDNYGNSR